MRAALLLLSLSLFASAQPLSNGEPKSPADEKKTFQLAPGYRIDLVAAEPEVIDPVAMCFDHTGAIFVCEMIGYPNGGVATGMESRGRIRKLLDKDGDGRYETAITFAEGLRFPTGITCWRDGVIVANAPDITFFHDQDSDGRSDLHEVLYTGFDLRNIQQLPNSLQFHRDGWIYAMVGLNGGTVTCPKKPGMTPLELRGRGIRFKPDEPGKIEPISGGGQYGLTHDGQGHWFTATNSQHLRQIVIPDEYLRRNPHFAAPAVTADIPEHGPAAKVFRISPFEAWRLERTERRKEEKAKRPASELVPGGYFTSACSPLVYRGTQFDARTVFVCDPANNLIHREKLVPTDGPLFTAKRIDEGKEFLASTDNWFRPVFICQGPDEAIYICDFYREAIETPLSLPDDLKKRMNLESRQRGRIWRIAKVNNEQTRLQGFKTDSLYDYLLAIDRSKQASQWLTEAAIRRIHELRIAGKLNQSEYDDAIREILGCEGTHIPLYEYMAETAKPSSKYQIESLSIRLSNETIDDDRFVDMMKLSEHAIRDGSEKIVNCLRLLLLHKSPFLRFQAVLGLGEADRFAFTKDEWQKLKKDLKDPWFATAVMTTLKKVSEETLLMLAADAEYPGEFVKQVAACYHHRTGEIPISLFEKSAKDANAVKALEGITAALRQRGKDLDDFWENKPDQWKKVEPYFEKQFAALSENPLPQARLQSVQQLMLADFKYRMTAAKTLLKDSNIDLQLAALRLVSSSKSPDVTMLLINTWPNAGLKLRTALEEELFARTDRLEALLKAVESKAILPNDVSRLKVDQLRHHRNATIRKRAETLFAVGISENRKKIIEDYKTALELPADKARGKAVFAKNCAACHQLEKVGNDVGANLTAALPNKTKAALMLDILDPSREVDPRYVNYQVETVSGRTITGILAVETATSITLRRAEKAEDTILRTDIEELKASKKSLMPEDLEKTVSKQDLADLLEYLVTVGR